jgi:hypothetical protein
MSYPDNDDDLDSDFGPEPDEEITDVTAKTPEGYNGDGYFKNYASVVFPNAVWTGGSGIHASVARGGVIPGVPFPEKAKLILKSMVDSGFFQYVQRVMNKHAGGMEWIISPEDFENLLLLDLHRLSNGLPTTETKARLQNPSTGNYFHRVTLLEDKNIVGGVRVWIEGSYDGEDTQIGFRYRLERIIPEGEETQEDAAQRIRQRTSQQVLEEASEALFLKENLKEVEGEPLTIETYIEEKDF